MLTDLHFFCIVWLATIYISGLEKNQPYRETSLLSKAQQEKMKTMDAAGVFELFENILSTHCRIPQGVKSLQQDWKRNTEQIWIFYVLIKTIYFLVSTYNNYLLASIWLCCSHSVACSLNIYFYKLIGVFNKLLIRYFLKLNEKHLFSYLPKAKTLFFTFLILFAN